MLFSCCGVGNEFCLGVRLRAGLGVIILGEERGGERRLGKGETRASGLVHLISWPPASACELMGAAY